MSPSADSICPIFRAAVHFNCLWLQPHHTHGRAAVRLTEDEAQSCSGLRSHRVPLSLVPWLKCAVEVQSEHRRRAQHEKQAIIGAIGAMDAGRRSPTPGLSCVNVAGSSGQAARFRCCSRSHRVFLSPTEASSSLTRQSCSSVVLSQQLPRRVWIEPECAPSRAARSGTHQLRTLLDHSLWRGSPVLSGRTRLWGDTGPKYSN